MTKRIQRTKLLHEGEYVAEVVVELEEDESGWSPYLTVQEAERLDTVREALRTGDIGRAAQEGTVYKLTPVAV